MTRKPLMCFLQIAASVLGLDLCPAYAADAQTVVFGPDLVTSGWQDLTFSGLTPTRFSAVDQDELRIVSERSSSLLWRSVEPDAWSTISASWSWRVDRSVSPTPLDVEGKDDRAIAVFFLFARDEDAARAAAGSKSLSSAMWWSSGSALVYVWGGDQPTGAVIPSPQMGDHGQQIILHPANAPLSRWMDEAVDLGADFRRAFGRPPGPLIGIAIASDSDDTGGINIASLRAMTLVSDGVK